MKRDDLELHAKLLEEQIAESVSIITQAKFWLSLQDGNEIAELHATRDLRHEIDQQETWIDRYQSYLHEVRCQLAFHVEEQSSQRQRD